MAKATDNIWRDPNISKRYLKEFVGALPLEMEQLDIMLRLLRNNGQKIERFMDIGCGDGILSAFVADNFPGAKGILLDFSSTMLDAARIKLKDFSEDMDFVKADYGHSNWLEKIKGQENQLYDAIVSRLSIHHQPDARKFAVYEEIYSLLKPGGIFINIEHVAPVSSWGKEMFEEYMVDHLYTAQRDTSDSKHRDEIAEDFKSRHEKDANIVSSVEIQCDWMRKIGFIDVDCYFKVFELAIFAGHKQVGAL